MLLCWKGPTYKAVSYFLASWPRSIGWPKSATRRAEPKFRWLKKKNSQITPKKVIKWATLMKTKTSAEQTKWLTLRPSTRALLKRSLSRNRCFLQITKAMTLQSQCSTKRKYQKSQKSRSYWIWRLKKVSEKLFNSKWESSTSFTTSKKMKSQ